MSEMAVDGSKRRFLVAMSAAVGGVAAVGAATPLVMSMMPSARALAAGAPVEVDISKIEPGMMLTVEWRGKPVWIVNRTPEMLAMLGKDNDRLTDPNSDLDQQPEYCKNPHRSIKPEFFVGVGVCTHLGCAPSYRPEVGPADLGQDWHGGFFCPCHGSRYDLASRVFKGSPAPKNMLVPPYKYLSDSKILVGEDHKA
ncbi:MAG: ubiquinol-cytochrome c reductase iron-sulfur subunit [Hydrogenophilales bacterium CG03_land_8_20_14_0_80_62_28]|nr:ubiquinol-cytochrome c reductase iron-sulfur subunit [Betaproteobacteria bacterium]OIO79518.1 MAG: ubiquinol-cytochrome c reductase iron-sulfur subunit [Hydrogenophilaceae bacterium CG1_02_62_390]PIV21651.1 MAG: ubiquinol-cytochrome c reductase iron-sulfur subunit [Hydrogenophilales bacterium CG03_land_8_20_14_0_80_62_28]PIW38173.1 MAG: ubiquinol-cytochrome c reductase iron-sulfur subunit [Hydrogenophilales bacterium CG15_BIG_FIL_POST_REV_8_21_14_020_62_31]PIW71371.1 MAG: ubiquinol-cytochrom